MSTDPLSMSDSAISHQVTLTAPKLASGIEKPSSSLPPELPSDREQKQRKQRRAQQGLEDLQNSPPRVGRSVLGAFLKGSRIHGSDRALSHQTHLRPQIRRPSFPGVPRRGVRLRLPGPLPLQPNSGERQQRRKQNQGSKQPYYRLHVTVPIVARIPV